MEKLGITDKVVFNYCGFQIVRREFLSHDKAPVITFGDFKVWVNSACIQKFPGINCIQIMINPYERKAILLPCSENVKDSLAWCIDKDNIRKPRQLTCRLLVVKLLELMNWDAECRYRIIGDFVSTNAENLMLFDLNSAERIHSLKARRKSIGSTKNISEFPEEWRDNFGPPVEEHSRLTKIKVFEDYTILTLDNFGGK